MAYDLVPLAVIMATCNANCNKTTFYVVDMIGRVSVIALLAFLMLTPLCTSVRSNEAIYGQHVLAQDTQTIWHHDCSNATGFMRVDNWTTDFEVTYADIESDGNYLLFENVTDVEGAHGQIFVYEFNETFQLAAFEWFHTNIHIYNSFLERGEINIYLADEMRFPVVETYILDEWDDPEAPWDVYYYRGNRYHSLMANPGSTPSISYSDNTISSDLHSNITHHHDQIWTAGPNYLSLGSVTDVDVGRTIKYLVIEYCEYDISDQDVTFAINDIIVAYNTNTVQPHENLDLYYLIPNSYRWYGDELVLDEELVGFYLAQPTADWFYAFITAGTWRISITHETGLQLRIETTVNGTMTRSGSGSGDYPSIDFVASARTPVIVDVIENSVDGESSGYYNITLQYVSSSTTPITDTTSTTSSTSTTTSTESSSSTETSPTSTAGAGFELPLSSILGAAIIAFAIIIVGSMILAGRRMMPRHQSSPKVRSSIARTPQDLDTVEVHIRDIPEEYQPVHETREIIRTIRLPTSCPNCGSPVIQEEIDWTGPLQAKCNYCGHPIRATFEPV